MVGREPGMSREGKERFEWDACLPSTHSVGFSSPGMQGMRIQGTDWLKPAGSNMEVKLTQTSPQNPFM